MSNLPNTQLLQPKEGAALIKWAAICGLATWGKPDLLDAIIGFIQHWSK